MSYVPAEPIASGKPYEVVGVDDHSPAGLDDFVGERAFTIATSGDRTSRVTGVGVTKGDSVRFAEKDAAGTKDVRVWRVRRTATGFTAEHAASF